MEPLVSTAETRLAEGGLLAIFAGLLLRLVLWYALAPHSYSLLDTQLVVAGLLVAALNLAGLLLPRTLAGIPQFLGLLGWAYGLSVLPLYSAWGRGDRADWAVYTALGLALLSYLARGVMQRRWSAEIYGKGWAWIDNWAQARSLRARVLAKKALVTLGYRRAREIGESVE